MKGKGWKLRVWENLGWHYSIYAGALSIHVNHYLRRVRYSSLMADRASEHIYGSSLWTDNESYGDPNRAARAAVQLAEGVMANLTKVLDVARAAVGRKR
jgi:hypothetical protein